MRAVRDECTMLCLVVFYYRNENPEVQHYYFSVGSNHSQAKH